MWFAEFYGDIEMCTLMEKDALIELASDVQAYMARHNTTNLITDSELEIGKIKGWMYSTNPDFIDFNGVVKHCNHLKNSFNENKPHTSSLRP